MTKAEMKGLIDQQTELRNKIIAAVKEALLKIGHAVEFDWEECYAPSYASGSFGDDLNDAYITKIWLNGDLIKVNLHAYYIGDDVENISLADECCVDYEDILDCLIDELED